MRTPGQWQGPGWISQYQRDCLPQLCLLVRTWADRVQIASLTTSRSYANVTLGQTCINENKAYVAYSNGAGAFAQVISRDKWAIC